MKKILLVFMILAVMPFIALAQKKDSLQNSSVDTIYNIVNVVNLWKDLKGVKKIIWVAASADNLKRGQAGVFKKIPYGSSIELMFSGKKLALEIKLSEKGETFYRDLDGKSTNLAIVSSDRDGVNFFKDQTYIKNKYVEEKIINKVYTRILPPPPEGK